MATLTSYTQVQVVSAVIPVDSQTCCWMVVQSVQYLRTQLSQVFVQILALQLDTELHHLPKQTLTSLNVRFGHYYVVFYLREQNVHTPL